MRTSAPELDCKRWRVGAHVAAWGRRIMALLSMLSAHFPLAGNTGVIERYLGIEMPSVDTPYFAVSPAGVGSGSGQITDTNHATTRPITQPNSTSVIRRPPASRPLILE